MGNNQDDRHSGKDRGDEQRDDLGYRGPQSQGGIGHKVVEAAHKDPHPEDAGLPGGPLGSRHPRVPEESLDSGDDGRPASGFSGDGADYDSVNNIEVPDDPDSPEARARGPEGGVGGRSGTGDARPHHGFDDRSGQSALGQPVDPDAQAPVPTDTDDAYQSGGTQQDRAQRIEERKHAESGKGSTRRDPRGRADPSPGTPVKRTHSD